MLGTGRKNKPVVFIYHLLSVSLPHWLLTFPVTLEYSSLHFHLCLKANYIKELIRRYVKKGENKIGL